MALLGYSLDNLSLMALTIAVGFVVDDAVIVIENVIRRMEHGATAVAATLGALGQMGSTIISITAALIAAMIPVLFMPDIVGRYFREFGLTLVAAITLSAAITLTLTPMMRAPADAPLRPLQRRAGSSRLSGLPMAAYTRSSWIGACGTR